MIIERVDEELKTVFEAGQDLLFVQVPADETHFHEGFASKVLQRFPAAAVMLRQAEGVPEGEATILDNFWRLHEPRPAYGLVVAATHRRGRDGWDNTPALTKQCLANITTMTRWGTQVTLAVQGDRETGFDRRSVDARSAAIAQAFQSSAIFVHLYGNSLDIAAA